MDTFHVRIISPYICTGNWVVGRSVVLCVCDCIYYYFSTGYEVICVCCVCIIFTAGSLRSA